MFKLISDPTQYPIQEVDLSQAGARVHFVPSPTVGTKNVLSDRPDGSTAVWARRPRTSFEINITDGISLDQYRDLVELMESEKPISLFPNYDKNTKLWMPLTASEYGYTFNEVSQKFEKRAANIEPTSLTNTRYNLTKHGHYEAVGVDDIRLRESNLGKGYYATAGRTNLVPNDGHPESGTLVWSGYSGSPTLSWTTEENSPAKGYGGCLKVNCPQSASHLVAVAVDSGDATTGNYYIANVWVKGRGRINASLGYGLNTVQENDIDLTGEWQQIELKLPKNYTNTTVALYLSVEAYPWYGKLYIGPASIKKQQASSTEAISDWDGAGNFDQEYLTVAPTSGGAAFTSNDLTIACCGIMLERTQTQRMLYSYGSSYNNILAIYSSAGPTLYFANVGRGITIPADEWEAAVGMPYWLVARVQVVDEAITFSLDFHLNGIDYSVSQAPTANFMIDSEDGASILIGGVESNGQKTCDGLPQHIRIDKRYWTDNEVALHKKMFTDDGFRALTVLTQGKQYVINNLNLAPQNGNWNEMVGTISLSETKHDADFIIE